MYLCVTSTEPLQNICALGNYYEALCILMWLYQLLSMRQAAACETKRKFLARNMYNLFSKAHFRVRKQRLLDSLDLSSRFLSPQGKTNDKKLHLAQPQLLNLRQERQQRGNLTCTNHSLKQALGCPICFSAYPGRSCRDVCTTTFALNPRINLCFGEMCSRF